MPATVRKLIPLERPRTLEQLIDEAGAINSEMAAKKRTYDALREKIATLMPIEMTEEGSVPVIQDGEVYQAEHGYQVEKIIAPKDLHEVAPELFWQLAKVQIGLAESVLAPDVFHDVVQVGYRDKPTLIIRKKSQVK